MRFIKKHIGILALVGAVAFTVTVLVVVALTSTSKQGASEGPSAHQTPASMPTTTANPQAGEAKNEDSGTAKQDCNVLLPVAEYDVLASRIMKYEELRLQPTSSQQQQELSLLTTAKYRSDHAGDPADDSAGDVSIEVNAAETTMTCQVVSDGRVIVLVNPVVTTYEVDASGNKTAENSDLQMPAHYSGWLKEGNDWLVDSEYS